MAKLFRTFALVLAALFALSLIVGCGGGEEEEEAAADAAFSSATPASGGDLAANGSISVTFDNDPGDVTVSAGTVTPSGKTRTITGPFTPGALTLTISWTNGGGSHTLTYNVTAPDETAPTVTGGTVKDGDEDVDPEAINGDGKIEVTFSEDVSGNIALQTEGGDDVGWIGKVEGTTGTLELVKGKEIGNETTYVIKGKVSDAAGNETEVSVTFTTKGKE
ncbi:Ig-like domain-containing protein [Candidatus Poribacteria bacterium]|nr:Ig-like domain-containing protein [Candidatus Poribacteria bacterium]